MVFGPFVLSLELLYALIALACCMYACIKGMMYYQISGYKGIKYFSYAFLFIGIALLSRLTLLTLIDYGVIGLFSPVHAVLMFCLLFFVTLAVFYLLYSVIWKYFEGFRLRSVWHRKHLLLVFLAALIAYIEVYLAYTIEPVTSYIAFTVQLAVLGAAIILTFKKRGICMYAWILMLLFLCYLSVFLASIYGGLFPVLSSNVYGLIDVFLILIALQVYWVSRNK